MQKWSQDAHHNYGNACNTIFERFHCQIFNLFQTIASFHGNHIEEDGLPSQKNKKREII